MRLSLGMILDKINAYQSGEYTWGQSIELLNELFPEKKKLISILFKVDDHFSRSKIEEWVSSKNAELLSNIQAANFNTSLPPKAKINLELLPADLRNEYLKQNARIREISSLHARLYNCSTNSHRLELSKRIISLVSERQSVFDRVDAFMASGNDIKPEEFKNQRAIPGIEKNYEVEYKLKLLRTRRTKLAKNPARITELNQVIKQIKELESNRYV